MKASAMLVAAMALLAAAGFIGAWREGREAADTARKIGTLRAQRGTIEHEAEGFAARLAAAQTTRAKLQSELDNLSQAQRAVPPAAVKKVPPRPPNPMELLATDPQLQLKSRAAQRVGIARQFGPLFRKLQLTPGQIERFTDGIIRRAEQQQDLDAVMRERGLAKDAPELATLKKEAADEFERNGKAVLGSEAYAEFRDYERTLELRAIVGQFAGASVVSNVPLSAAQAEQLVGVLAAARSGVDVTSTAIRPSEIDWGKADAQAARVLSPEQLALFQTIEPIGGGPSRWWARLDQEVANAKKVGGGAAEGALNALGKKGPNG